MFRDIFSQIIKHSLMTDKANLRLVSKEFLYLTTYWAIIDVEKVTGFVLSQEEYQLVYHILCSFQPINFYYMADQKIILWFLVDYYNIILNHPVYILVANKKELSRLKLFENKLKFSDKFDIYDSSSKAGKCFFFHVGTYKKYLSGGGYVKPIIIIYGNKAVKQLYYNDTKLKNSIFLLDNKDRFTCYFDNSFQKRIKLIHYNISINFDLSKHFNPIAVKNHNKQVNIISNYLLNFVNDLNLIDNSNSLVLHNIFNKDKFFSKRKLKYLINLLDCFDNDINPYYKIYVFVPRMGQIYDLYYSLLRFRNILKPLITDGFFDNKTTNIPQVDLFKLDLNQLLGIFK